MTQRPLLCGPPSGCTKPSATVLTYTSVPDMARWTMRIDLDDCRQPAWRLRGLLQLLSLHRWILPNNLSHLPWHIMVTSILLPQYQQQADGPKHCGRRGSTLLTKFNTMPSCSNS